MKHLHAELMKQYAEDAMETDRPWERWQSKHNDTSDWRDSHGSLSWFTDYQYRRKPESYSPTFRDLEVEYMIQSQVMKIRNIRSHDPGYYAEGADEGDYIKIAVKQMGCLKKLRSPKMKQWLKQPKELRAIAFYPEE